MNISIPFFTIIFNSKFQIQIRIQFQLLKKRRKEKKREERNTEENMSGKRFGSAESLRMEICENLAYVNASADMANFGAPRGMAQDNFTQAFFKGLLALPPEKLEETCGKVLDLVEEEKRKASGKDDQKRKIHVEIIVKKVEIFVLKMTSGALTEEALEKIRAIVEEGIKKYEVSVDFFGLADLSKFVGVDIQQDERAKSDFMNSIESLFTK